MMHKLSPDSVCKVPRTHNNEGNTAQSPVLNDNQLPSKKGIYIKTFTLQQERYWTQEEKAIL
jgi:hypothetical protein